MTFDYFDEIEKLEERLGLPNKFYFRLQHEDDWSFVIKLNALFEAACTHAISDRLHSTEIVDSLSNLELANSRCGKVKLLKDLKILSKEQGAFIVALASLRNRIVHKIENVSFSFESYLAGLDDNQTKTFANEFGYTFIDPIEIQGTVVSRKQFVYENPKTVIWLSAADLIACLHLEFEIAKVRLMQMALDEYKRLNLNPAMPKGLLEQMRKTSESDPR